MIIDMNNNIDDIHDKEYKQELINDNNDGEVLDLDLEEDVSEEPMNNFNSNTISRGCIKS